MSALIFFSFALSASKVFADYDELTKENYEKNKDKKAVVIYGINWGRRWGCGRFENAQLKNLTFVRLNPGSSKLDEDKIVLNTPSTLFAENVSSHYAIIVNPGEYVLAGFDVKIAKSAKEVGHLKSDIGELFENGKSIDGTFTVNSGEIVYIGDFGLDCVYEPIPWRYYIEKADWETFLAGFREKYKFIGSKKIIYRLFQTKKFGQ